AIFRLDAHLKRLYDSTKIYRTPIPYTIAQFEEAIKETIRANKMEACYIRPIVYRGYGDVGVNPLGCPVDVTIAVWEWGAYLGAAALESGIEVTVASWQRPAPNTIPSMAKAGGNYLGSQLIKMDAIVNGFSEGIALDTSGNISEGSGENIFLVKDETVYTPPVVAALLPGITRASVMTLARDAGYTVVEANIPREMLFTADEVFFTGTAAEITPIRSVDKNIVGEGKPGPVTRNLQKFFFDVVQNGNDKYNWLNFVYD
ncbi:MAG: branched-chain-amino-acid transaminase, partial [Bacteroidota bacterium]